MSRRTVKAPRCTARYDGDGPLCVLPDGHARPHQAKKHLWASDHSAEKIELDRLRRSVRELFASFESDATMPDVTYTSQFLIDEMRRYFPHLRRTPPKLKIAL